MNEQDEMDVRGQEHAGGPAFPIPMTADEVYYGQGSPDGMSLRDYFAAKAMQALVMRFEDETLRDQVPPTAYAIADDMLVEREK